MAFQRDNIRRPNPKILRQAYLDGTTEAVSEVHDGIGFVRYVRVRNEIAGAEHRYGFSTANPPSLLQSTIVLQTSAETLEVWLGDDWQASNWEIQGQWASGATEVEILMNFLTPETQRGEDRESSSSWNRLKAAYSYFLETASQNLRSRSPAFIALLGTNAVYPGYKIFKNASETFQQEQAESITRKILKSISTFFNWITTKLVISEAQAKFYITALFTAIIQTYMNWSNSGKMIQIFLKSLLSSFKAQVIRMVVRPLVLLCCTFFGAAFMTGFLASLILSYLVSTLWNFIESFIFKLYKRMMSPL